MLVFRVSGSNRWEKKATSGAVPPPLHSHTASVVGSVMYVFGGHDGTQCKNDLYSLNLGILFSLFLSSPSSFFSSFLFSPLSTLPRFILPFLCVADTFAWTKLANVRGNFPAARFSHKAGVMGTKVYVYGGNAGSATSPALLGDLHAFDTRMCRGRTLFSHSY